MTAAEVGEKSEQMGADTLAFASYLKNNMKPDRAKHVLKYISTRRMDRGARKLHDRLRRRTREDLKKVIESGESKLIEQFISVALLDAAKAGMPLEINFSSDHSKTYEFDPTRCFVKYLIEEFEKLKTRHDLISPSEWAESKRFLPKSVTPFPGKFRFLLAPYMREILDCASPESPVREVDVMKGSQVTYTVAILENLIGYYAEHIKTEPMMFVSAEAEMAKHRMNTNVLPMFEQSGLSHIIQSSDTGNIKKSGQTKDKLEFMGGAWLSFFGARNPNKGRQNSVMLALFDEIDGWPSNVGKDGNPMQLFFDRTKAYESTRKVFRGSTPTIKGQSNIETEFFLGDQRYYNVPCRKCGEFQVLEFNKVNDQGKKYGLVWEMEKNRLKPGTVRYRCKHCLHDHINSDKSWMYQEKNGAHWVPTAEPITQDRRSYHISALYSPVGMMSWDQVVISFLRAYNSDLKTVKDIRALQKFYNNELGVPFEMMGMGVKFEQVSSHRRNEYSMGEIPNDLAERLTGGKIQFLTCQVDVHEKNLALAVMGWTKGARCFLIDYFRIPGEDCTQISDKSWQAVRDWIEPSEDGPRYIADDGRGYNIICTFIDAGFSQKTVTDFTGEWESSVHPILGRNRSNNSRVKEFQPWKTGSGQQGYTINVDHYKDMLAPILRREWVDADESFQDYFHFNAPFDISDKQLKELTVERRNKEVDQYGNVRFTWVRPSHSHNELWDLLVYGHAAVEIIALALCTDPSGPLRKMKLEKVDYDLFWDACEEDALYYTAA